MTIGNEVVPAMKRGEYLYLLKEANDEGRIHRRLNGTIESRAQWESNNYWEIHPKELREEFYRAYRAGYLSEHAYLTKQGK